MGLWHQDGASTYFARAQIVNRLLEIIELVLLCVEFHLALCSKDHQLCQVIVAPYEVADDVDLARDDVWRWLVSLDEYLR